MNWIERYVSAFKNYLPAKSRNDVGEELTSLLALILGFVVDGEIAAVTGR